MRALAIAGIAKRATPHSLRHSFATALREPRSGWVVLDVPPLEAWAERLRWLTPAERERVESAEFYQLLQQHVTRRFLASRVGRS